MPRQSHWWKRTEGAVARQNGHRVAKLEHRHGCLIGQPYPRCRAPPGLAARLTGLLAQLPHALGDQSRDQLTSIMSSMFHVACSTCISHRIPTSHQAQNPTTRSLLTFYSCRQLRAWLDRPDERLLTQGRSYREEMEQNCRRQTLDGEDGSHAAWYDSCVHYTTPTERQTGAVP